METNKTPQMEAALEDLGSVLFGRSRSASAANQMCISCGTDANHFRDELSRKEYRISRMCQDCQDKVFSWQKLFLWYTRGSYGTTTNHIWKRQAERHLAFLFAERVELPRSKKLSHESRQGNGEDYRSANARRWRCYLSVLCCNGWGEATQCQSGALG